MIFLWQFLKKEKFWSLLCLIFMTVGSTLTIGQALMIANVTSLTINLSSVQTEGGEGEVGGNSKEVNLTNQSGLKSSLINEKNQDLIEKSLFQKVYQTFYLIIKEGNQTALKYILDHRDFSFLLLLGFVCFLFIVITQGLLFLRDFSSQYLAYRIGNRIRVFYMEKLISLPSLTFKNKKSGDFLSRGINDIKQVEAEIFPFLESAFYGPLLTVIGLFTLFFINWEFTIILFLMFGVLGVAVQIISSALKAVVKKVQEQLSDITHHLQELIYAIDIIKIFNREKFERKQFVKKTDHILALLKKQTFIHYLNRPMSEMIIAIGIIGIIFYSATMIWQKELTITEMFSFFAVLLYITPYMQRISNAFFLRQKIAVPAGRVEEISTLYPSEERGYLDNTTPTKKLSSSYQGYVTLKEVGFNFQDDTQAKQVLSNVSFTAQPGEFIAIVGESGGGKSTLLNLIATFIQPDQGEILYGDEPNHQLNLCSVRDHIAIVTQESLLFPDTIRKNILYGNLEATDEEFQKIVKLAEVDSFVKNLPNGYETEIGERGLKISGGQKQRICIARALIKKPKILLLDEATSSLDSQSEKAIQEALKQILHQQTTFVIAHRLSTILEADKIIVIHQGKVDSQGTHQELLKKSEIYSNLYKLQFR